MAEVQQADTTKEITTVTITYHRLGGECYSVGKSGVNKIETFTKAGMYGDIPYVRILKDGEVYAEFCQHNILGVYYGEPKTNTQKIIDKEEDHDRVPF